MSTEEKGEPQEKSWLTRTMVHDARSTEQIARKNQWRATSLCYQTLLLAHHRVRAQRYTGFWKEKERTALQ